MKEAIVYDTGVMFNTVMVAIVRDRYKKFTFFPSLCRLTGHWRARRCGEEEIRNCRLPHLPSHSTSSQVQWLIATPLFSSYLMTRKKYGRHYLPSLSTRRESSQLMRYVDLNCCCKQLTDVNITQPAGLRCIVKGSQ
jgi:hypothetical protein